MSYIIYNDTWEEKYRWFLKCSNYDDSRMTDQGCGSLAWRYLAWPLPEGRQLISFICYSGFAKKRQS